MTLCYQLPKLSVCELFVYVVLQSQCLDVYTLLQVWNVIGILHLCLLYIDCYLPTCLWDVFTLLEKNISPLFPISLLWVYIPVRELTLFLSHLYMTCNKYSTTLVGVILIHEIYWWHHSLQWFWNYWELVSISNSSNMLTNACLLQVLLLGIPHNPIKKVR